MVQCFCVNKTVLVRYTGVPTMFMSPRSLTAAAMLLLGHGSCALPRSLHMDTQFYLDVIFWEHRYLAAWLSGEVKDFSLQWLL